MSTTDRIPAPLSIGSYIEDGARIAAILLVWGVLSLFATHILSEIGGTGSLFSVFGPWLGEVLGQIGLLNAVLYVLYRTIDYWQA